MDFEVDEKFLAKLSENDKKKKLAQNKNITKKQLKHVEESDDSVSSDDSECRENFEQLINFIKTGTKEELIQFMNDSDKVANENDSNENNAKSDPMHLDDLIDSNYETDEDCSVHTDFKNDDLNETDDEIEFKNVRNQKTIRLEKTEPRARKRAERKEKKKKELEDKLKAIKEEEDKEIFEKLTKSNPEFMEHLKNDGIDTDFDIDYCMKKMEEYHNKPINDDEDIEKPVFSDEDIYPVEPSNVPIRKRKSKKSKKKKKQEVNELDEDVEETNDFILPSDKKLSLIAAKYNFNDKFKYTDTMPMNYGLTNDEIIYANDKELNKYASFKYIKEKFSGAEREQHLEKKYTSERMIQKKKETLKSVYVKEDAPQQTDEVESRNNDKKWKPKKRKYNLPEYGERYEALKIKKEYYNHKLRKAE